MVIPASTALLASAGGAAAQLPLASRVIAAGDLVIVYESHVSMRSVYVQSSGSYVNRYGTFLHKARVGLALAAAPPARCFSQQSAAQAQLCTCKITHMRAQRLFLVCICRHPRFYSHTGLDRPAIWRACTCPPAGPRLGTAVGTNTRTMDCSAAAPHADLVRG
jgi:hypothetical protein